MRDKIEHADESTQQPLPEPFEGDEPEPRSLLSIPPHDGGKCKRGWTRAELADEMREQ